MYIYLHIFTVYFTSYFGGDEREEFLALLGFLEGPGPGFWLMAILAPGREFLLGSWIIHLPVITIFMAGMNMYKLPFPWKMGSKNVAFFEPHTKPLPWKIAMALFRRIAWMIYGYLEDRP